MKNLSRPVYLLLLLTLFACGSGTKMQRIRQQELQASLGLSRGEVDEERKSVRMGSRDTLTVRNDEGKEIIIMKAVRDEQTGEMVASDVIDAAVISARFRNVAERLGLVDIRFEISVPASMQDSKWQLRLHPLMFIQADTLQLPAVIVTGEQYRQEQLKGYVRYERYLRGIITDSTRFIDRRNLNIWIERNLSHKDPSGPEEQLALLHYTRKQLKRYHQKKWNRRGEVFEQYVPSPICTEGIQLDTVLENVSSDLVYEYVHSFHTRPKLKKVEVVLTGDIYQEDRKLYVMPPTQPLSFYVSSLSDLAVSSATSSDSLYRRGVSLLQERDYPAALTLLRPYRDVNTALAYMALDYNASALEILTGLPRTAQVNYLLALLYARKQEEEKAVQCFLDACRENRALLFRGNLDPEIHVLIQRFGLDANDNF